MYLNSQENIWFHIISTAVVAQSSFNPAPLLLLQSQDQWVILKSMSLNHQPSNQFNKSSNCCGRATGGQLLSSAVSSSLSQLWLRAHASEHPKRRWFCLWQGCSQQCWTVESASAEGEWSFFPDVPCFSCICWTTLPSCRCKIGNLPESVHFAQELCLLSIIMPSLLKWSGKAHCTFKGSAGGAGFAALHWQPASGAVLAYWWSTLQVVDPCNLDNWYWEHTTGGEAGDDKNSASEYSSGALAGWLWLGFEDDFQDQRGPEQILQIDDAVDCAGSLDPSCVKCEIRVSVAEHRHNLCPYSLQMWSQYLPRLGIRSMSYHALAVCSKLGILFYILSRLGSICRGYILSRLGSIRWGYILSRLGCICRGLACYSIKAQV